jgi:hypothetical protein
MRPRLVLAGVLASSVSCSVPSATPDDPDGASADAPTGDARIDAGGDAAAMGDAGTVAMLAMSPTEDGDFGGVLAGATGPVVGTSLRNEGDQPSGTIDLAIPTSAAFEIVYDHCGGVDLAGHTSCDFGVLFHPTTVGDATTLVAVTATPGGTMTRSFAGTGLPHGVLSADQTQVDLGEVPIVGSAATRTLVFHDLGPNAVLVGAVTYAGSEGVTIQSSTCGGWLSTAFPCTVALRFDPATVGAHSGALTVAVPLGTTITVGITATATARVTVDHAGAGAGRIVSQEPGLDCTACSADFATPQVHLNAQPSPGSTFAGWAGDCAGAGTCALTLSGDKQATARFDLTP